MIAECNANNAKFAKIVAFLHENPPQQVELLPYRAMGENKHRALGLGEPPRFTAPDTETLEVFRKLLPFTSNSFPDFP